MLVRRARRARRVATVVVRGIVRGNAGRGKC